MAGRYGISFAKSLIERGDYEEAVDSATKDIDEGNRGPEPLFDRATALDLLERYEDAVRDFEAAIATNRAEKELDPFVLDDAYFSALVAAARAEKEPIRGVATLERYRGVMPDGGHLGEVTDWQKRLRGEMPSLLDKTKDVDAV
jgi:tetratricopeptide (TPR) repeat protein